MDLEQFASNEQVGGSNPLVLFSFFRLRSSMESERRSTKPEVVRSSRTGAIVISYELLITNWKNDSLFVIRNL